MSFSMAARKKHAIEDPTDFGNSPESLAASLAILCWSCWVVGNWMFRNLTNKEK